MRIFRLVRAVVSALCFTAMMTLAFYPPTAAERAALGPGEPKFELMQMRLVMIMMAVAPNSFARGYATALGVPEDRMRDSLEAKAAGRGLVSSAGEPAKVQPAEDDPAPARRIEAGGAAFIRVN